MPFYPYLVFKIILVRALRLSFILQYILHSRYFKDVSGHDYDKIRQNILKYKVKEEYCEKYLKVRNPGMSCEVPNGELLTLQYFHRWGDWTLRPLPPRPLPIRPIRPLMEMLLWTLVKALRSLVKNKLRKCHLRGAEVSFDRSEVSSHDGLKCLRCRWLIEMII